MRLELPATNADVQTFTADDMDEDTGVAEWTKPPLAAVVVVTCIGPGGPGGSGNCVATVADLPSGVGGGGGTGGAYTEIAFPAASLPDAVGVFVDFAAPGAVGVTAGNGGTADRYGPARIYNLDTQESIARALSGLPGVGGGGGEADVPLLPSAANALGGGQFTSAGGGLGGNAAGSTHRALGEPIALFDPAHISSGSPGPGGGGGGIYGGVPDPGGWGGSVGMFGEIGQGTPGGLDVEYDAARPANPGVDALPSVARGLGVPGSGGSGGAASVAADGGRGANGAMWGAGGGGGGASVPGFTSGAGGDGGPGVVIIATYF